jgi:hypothetical protein
VRPIFIIFPDPNRFACQEKISRITENLNILAFKRIELPYSPKDYDRHVRQFLITNSTPVFYFSFMFSAWPVEGFTQFIRKKYIKIDQHTKFLLKIMIF